MKVSTHPLIHRKHGKQVIRTVKVASGEIQVTLRAGHLWLRKVGYSGPTKWIKVMTPVTFIRPMLNSLVGYEHFPLQTEATNHDFC